MVDSTLAFDILARDHASSTFDKVARSADKTAAALKKSAKVSDDVAKAELRLSKARDTESDSMGRVKVAEQRLQELRDKGLQGTSRFTAAEESLSSARRKAAQASNTAKIAEDSLGKARAKLVSTSETVGKEAGGKFAKGFGDEAEKEGSKSGKKFGASLKRWLTGNGADIGKEGGTVFGSGFLGALKTPILGPAIVAIIGGAVATALPAVGAIAAGGLVAGFGAGLAGLGIVFAAKSEVVGRKWSATMAQLGADMRLLSRPFESTLVNIAGYFERTVDKFNPVLARAFGKMAPVVDRFVDSASTSLEQLVPAIDPITDAFDKVLDSMGPALRSAIGSLAAGLTELAESVERNPEALADAVRGIGEFTRSALQLVATLNNVNGKFEQLTGGVSLVDVTMEGLQATLAPLITLFAGLEKALDLVNAAAHSSEASGQSMSGAANKVTALAQAYQKTGAAAKGVVGPVETAAEKTARMKKEAAEAKERFEGLINAMFATANAALVLSGSAIGVQAAIDDASRSVKENGKTLDINTEKGRNNQQALNNLAIAANQQSEAMIRNHKSTATAAKTAEASKANFIRLAMQMGKSKQAATAMANEMISIPNVSRTAKLQANKADLDAKLASVKRQLADPKLSQTKRAKLTAEKSQLEAAVARAKAAIASVQGKTVYITAIVRQRGAIKAADSRLLDPGHARGGLIPGAPSSVDNRLIPMATGEFVVRASQVSKNRALLEAINAGRQPAQFASAGRGGAGGGGGGTVNLLFKSDGTPYMEFLIKEFRKYIRVQGGDVQAVLGRG